MKSILVAIAHYGSNNREYLEKCLHEWQCYYPDYSVHVCLYLTEMIDVKDFPGLTIYVKLYKPEIGKMLVVQHKQLFHDLRNQYDYFVYCEDDVAISLNKFKAFESVQENLPVPYVCGFFRYEYKDGNGYKFLFDQHPIHSCHRGGTTIIKSNYIIKNESYFEVYNFHQGCYVLTKKLLQHAIDSGKYLEQDNYYVGSPLEGAASDVFYKCGIVKVLPRNRVSELLVPHMPNKYVRMLPDIYTEQSTPDDIKISEWQMDIEPIYV
jgi:hypothetical protein